MGEGWPTLADVYRAVNATRGDVRELRAHVDALGERLERHEADDQRRLGDLEETTRRLTGRERWWAGGLALLGLLVTLVGAPVGVHLMTGG